MSWDSIKDEPAGRAARTAQPAIDAAKRHPATREITRWFDYEHLPQGTPRHVSAMCAAMAAELLREIDDSPELTAGLRKLLEAKDCFVRAAIASAE